MFQYLHLIIYYVNKFFLFSQAVAKFEENQASSRDEHIDSSIYFNALHKWQDIMKWNFELKNKENPPVIYLLFFFCVVHLY